MSEPGSPRRPSILPQWMTHKNRLASHLSAGEEHTGPESTVNLAAYRPLFLFTSVTFQRSQTPQPQSKHKWYEEFKVPFSAKKSRSSVTRPRLDATDNAHSVSAEPVCEHYSSRRRRRYVIALQHAIPERRTDQSLPSLPSIVIDAPKPEMLSGSSVQEPARNEPDLAKVDAAREASTSAILTMKTLSGSVEKGASTINQVDNPINLIDSVSSFLKSLERFNCIVDNIAAV